MREADLPRTIIETPNYRLVLENGTYSTFATLNLYGKQKDNFVNTYYVWVNETEALQLIKLLFQFKAKESLKMHEGLDHPHYFKPLKKYMPNA